MYIHIFRQETQTDFKRIEIFVVGFQNKSIDIKTGKEIITLYWDSEYSIEDLLYDFNLLFFLIEASIAFNSTGANPSERMASATSKPFSLRTTLCREP